MADVIRVLYVDDEPALLQIGKLFLERAGAFSIATIESAPGALDRLAKEQFDAIISDYQMPDMDGIQFLIEVRNRFGKIPFILFTGKGREEIVIQAINNGADFYLQKGGSPDAQFAELSHQILMIVAQRSAEKAFIESEHRYRSLVENTHGCVAIYRAVDDGEDFIILEFNHAAEKTENVARDEVIGHRVTEVFPGVQKFGILDVFRRVWRTGTSESFPVAFYKDNRISGWRDNFIFKLPSGEIVASYSDETARKQAEEALQHLTEFRESIITNAQVWMSVLDSGGKILAWNPAAAEISGYRSEEVIGKNEIWKMLYPEKGYRKQITTTINRIIRDKKHLENFETVIRTKEGNEKIISWNTKGIPDATGKISSYIAIGVDITERRKAEEAVRISRDYYLKLFDEFPNPIWRSDTTAKCDYFNKEWLAFTGRTLEQEMGDGWVEGVHPDDLDRCVKTYLKAFGARAAFEMEYRLRYHDGTYHWLLDIGKPHYGPEGDFTGYIGACYDITGRKKAEEDLQESRRILETVINTIPARVFWKDKNLIFLGCNTQFALDAGFEKPEQIIGSDDFVMGWWEQAELYRADDRMVIESGKPKLLIEEPQTTPSGERIYLLTSKVPLKDANGEIIGVLGTYLDITALKKVEEALKQSNKKLSLLSSITRHDINNQLMALNGFIELLHTKAQDPALKDYFNQISQVSSGIAATIRFTKEYEQIGVNAPAWQDCRTIVDTVAKEAMIGKVKLINDLPSGAEVFADPMIVKVFYNLIDNAVRYGGKITAIRFFVQESDDDRIFVCEDNGVGIPTEDKKIIFDRGFGTNSETSLAISMEILAITGITITETGEPGKGARFEMIVPKGIYR